ncbi:MAG: sel1 repeat family protein [Alphaproteobacteria bacterium]|nr:sel1 repeat family protein [Alphaproteobacteria bacterium]
MNLGSRLAGTTALGILLAAATVNLARAAEASERPVEPAVLSGPAQVSDRLEETSETYEKAQAYAFGLGVPQSREIALRWYESAARRGHVASMINLGVYHHHGLGTDRDATQAFVWFNLATAFGSTLALYNLVQVESTIGAVERAAALKITAQTLPEILATMAPGEIQQVREDAAALLISPQARRLVATLNTIRRRRDELARARAARGTLPDLVPIE